MNELQRERAIRIVDLIQWRLSSLETDLEDYVDIPCRFWKKAVAEHYERAMQPLIEAGIVERRDSYSTLLHQCKKYRINPEYMNDERKVIWYNYEQGKRKKNNSVVCKYTRRILRMLKLDKRAAKKYIETACSKVEIEKRLLFDEAVNGGKNLPVLIKNNSKEGFRRIFMSKEKALNYAKRTNRNLIEDGQKVVIDFMEAYIARKQRHVEFSYGLHIEKFYNGEYYANRNDTNQRLDSNITTIPSKLLSFFSLEGEPLVGLDLSNSQFAVMAKLLKDGKFAENIHQLEERRTIGKDKHSSYAIRVIKVGEYEEEVSEMPLYKIEDKPINHPYMCAKTNIKRGEENHLKPSLSKDLVQFIELAKSGELYEFIRDSAGLSTGAKGRKQAKLMMFEICFSKHNNHTPAKAKLRELFPNLVGMIDAYKKQNGDNQFAITLQQEESHLFIDIILPKLIKAGYKVLSKHDSILCMESDRKAVERLMREALDKALGNYQLKAEYAAKPVC